MGERGVLVFNSVSTETLDNFRAAVASVGWHISYETLLTVDQHNPITILQAKPGQG